MRADAEEDPPLGDGPEQRHHSRADRPENRGRVVDVGAALFLGAGHRSIGSVDFAIPRGERRRRVYIFARARVERAEAGAIPPRLLELLAQRRAPGGQLADNLLVVAEARLLQEFLYLGSHRALGEEGLQREARVRDHRGVEGGRVAGLLLGERRTARHPAGEVSRWNGPTNELRGTASTAGLPHSARRWGDRVLGTVGRGRLRSRRGLGGPLTLLESIPVRLVTVSQQFLAALLGLVAPVLFELGIDRRNHGVRAQRPLRYAGRFRGARRRRVNTVASLVAGGPNWWTHAWAVALVVALLLMLVRIVRAA